MIELSAVPFSERVGVGLLVGSLLLFLSWFRPARKSWVREWLFPIIGLVGWLIALIGVANLGAFIVINAFYRFGFSASYSVVRLIAGCGVLIGMYFAAIGGQVIGNLARYFQGLPSERIRWLRRSNHKANAR